MAWLEEMRHIDNMDSAAGVIKQFAEQEAKNIIANKIKQLTSCILTLQNAPFVGAPADTIIDCINDLENLVRNLNLASMARLACKLQAQQLTSEEKDEKA